jgi:hypothetical protein
MSSTYKRYEMAERRRQRDAQKRFREFEREAKEQAKLSAIAQAKFEVERYENQLEVILSVHKEQGEVWNWGLLATALPPVPPRNLFTHTWKAKRQVELEAAFKRDPKADSIAKAESLDEKEFQEVWSEYSLAQAEWQRLKAMALRVLAGEQKAYSEAVTEFGGLAEISDLGSSIHLTVHNAKVIECVLKVNGLNAIPNEVKTLTAAGKLSVKAMPKGRFHEIYQDYVCGCTLRVAREVFALLPVDIVFITASTDSTNPATGSMVDLPVLSVAFNRSPFSRLNFDELDPSAAVESFLHRCNFKASRKTGAFESIAPLTLLDLPQPEQRKSDSAEALSTAKKLRSEINVGIQALQSATREKGNIISPSL